MNVRRLHDRNLSAWWYLGFIALNVLPVIGWGSNIAYLVLMALPGTSGPNRFGEDPKDPAASEVFT